MVLKKSDLTGKGSALAAAVEAAQNALKRGEPAGRGKRRKEIDAKTPPVLSPKGGGDKGGGEGGGGEGMAEEGEEGGAMVEAEGQQGGARTRRSLVVATLRYNIQV